MTSYLSEWLLSKRQQMTNIGKDVEERKSLCTAGRMETGTANMEKSIWETVYENFKFYHAI